MENINFPYLFGRKGGAEIDLLDVLQCDSITNQFNELFTSQIEFDKNKNTLIKALYRDIQKTSSETEKKQLIRAKRAIYNNRVLNIDCDGVTLEATTILHLKNYHFQKEKHRKIEEAFQQNFYTRLYESIKSLGDITNQFFFKNGLLFSSHILWNQIQKTDFSYTSLNKKSKRLLVSVLKYLSRSTTKTTPFSSFNTVFWSNGSLKNESVLPVASRFQVNNLVFHFLKKELLCKKIFKDQLSIEVNSTLTDQNDKLTYFLNKENNESFKKLSKTAVLEYIMTQINNRNTSYSDLVALVLKATESSSETTRAFVDQLIEEGMLLLSYPVHQSDANWINQLQSFILEKETFQKDTFFRHFSPLLDFIKESLKILEEHRDVEIRKECIKNTYTQLFSFFEKQQLCMDLFEKMKSQDLFYEDTYQKVTPSISLQKQNKLSSTIKIAYQALNCVAQKKAYRKFLAAPKEEQCKGKMSLLDFYEKIYLKHHHEFRINASEMEHFNTSFLSLKKTLENSDNCNYVDIYDHFLTTKECAQKPADPFGVYFQATNNFNQIVINDFSKGNGSTISRFLNISSPKSALKVKDYIKDCYPEHLVAEIKDASIHNVNNFPPMADYVMSINEDHILRKQFKTISISDIYVETIDDDLCLVTKEGKKVKLINFSLEGLNRRSKFTQFLDIFDTSDTTGYSLFKHLVKQMYIDQLKNKEVVVAPRLRYGKEIILQRKIWFVKKEVLQQMIIKDNNHLHQNYKNINEWLEKHKIPNEVFVKISNRNRENTQDDNYKPQYINFKTPLFILLFMNLIDKAGDVFEISEMSPDAMSVKENGGYAKEYILNID